MYCNAFSGHCFTRARPETIKLPSMLDFYPLEDEKYTRISQFFKNLKERRLTTTKCKRCAQLLWPPRIVCPNCLSDELEWVDLGTEGELYAFTEMMLGAPLGFVARAADYSQNRRCEIRRPQNRRQG